MNTPIPTISTKSHHGSSNITKKRRKSTARPKEAENQSDPQPAVTPPPQPHIASSAISVIPPPPASPAPPIPDIPPPPTPSPSLGPSASSQGEIQAPPPPVPISSSTSSSSFTAIPPPPTPSPSPIIPPPPPPHQQPQRSPNSTVEVPLSTDSKDDIPPPLSLHSSASRSAASSSTVSKFNIPPPPSPLSPRTLQQQQQGGENTSMTQLSLSSPRTSQQQQQQGEMSISSPPSASASSSSSVQPAPSPFALNILPPPQQSSTTSQSPRTKMNVSKSPRSDVYIPPPPLPDDLKASIKRNRRASSGSCDIPPPDEDKKEKVRRPSADLNIMPPPATSGSNGEDERKKRKHSTGSIEIMLPTHGEHKMDDKKRRKHTIGGKELRDALSTTSSDHKEDGKKKHRHNSGERKDVSPSPHSDHKEDGKKKRKQSTESKEVPTISTSDHKEDGKKKRKQSTESKEVPTISTSDHKDDGKKKRKQSTESKEVPTLSSSDHKEDGKKKRMQNTPTPLPADLKASIINNPKTTKKRGVLRFLPADLKASIVNNRMFAKHESAQQQQQQPHEDTTPSITRNPNFNTITRLDIPPPPVSCEPDKLQDVVAEIRDKYRFPGFPKDPSADPASRRALKHAFDIEISYIIAVNVLMRCFNRSLRKTLGHLADKDLAGIFAGVEEMVATAGDVATKIIAVASSGERFFLLSVYMTCDAYMKAYKGFLEIHETSLLQLGTLQHTSEGFRKALAACTPPNGPELLDLFWLVVSRFKHICKIAQTQYVYRKSLDGILSSIKASEQFDAERICCYGGNCTTEKREEEGREGEKGEEGESSNWMVLRDENTSDAEAALKKIHETQPLVNRLSGIHESLGFFRKIHCRNGEIASSLKRTVLDTIGVTLQHTKTFGLSFTEPAFLIFFSDGLALCTSYKRASRDDTSKYQYELKNWYPGQELCVMKLLPQNFATIGFKITRKVRYTLYKDHAQHQSLSYAFAQSLSFAQSQSQPEPGDLDENPEFSKFAFNDMRTVLVESTETYASCVRLFKEVSGKDAINDVRPAAFQMIGVPLDTLLASERGLYGNRSNIPVLARFLLDYVTARGIEEKGVFRVTAEKNQVNMLAQRVNSVELSKVDWDGECTRVVSSLYKLFLRDMPAPLIPERYHDDLVHCVSVEPHEARIAAYAKCIASIRPRVNQSTLARLVRFLSLVAHNSHYNSMNSKNLAIVTAPSILWKSVSAEDFASISNANNAIEFLIDYYDDIFFYLNGIINSTGERASGPTSIGIAHYYDDDDIEDGGWVALRCKLLGHDAPIVAAARTPDKKRMISVDDDGKAILWNTDAAAFDREVSLGLGGGCGITAAALANGDSIWVSMVDRIRVFDATTYEDKGVIPIVCSTIAAVNGGSEVWCGCAGGVTIVNAATRTVVENVLIDNSASRRNNGSGSSNSGSTSVGGSEKVLIENGLTITHLAADDEHGKVWGAGWDYTKDRQHLYVWDRATRKLIADIPAHGKKINAVRVCFGAVYSCSDDLTVAVWDAKIHAQIKVIAGHKGAVRDICAVRGGSDGSGNGRGKRSLWTCSADGSILVWDPVTFRKIGVVRSYHMKEVNTLMAIERPDYTEVWSSGGDNSFCVWYSSQILVDL